MSEDGKPTVLCIILVTLALVTAILSWGQQ